jgi:hypothetical protein
MPCTGRQLASQARPSLSTVTVVVSFVQPYVPAPATSPLARTAEPASAGPACAGPASAGPASARPASSSHIAGPASKLGPGQARVAYSHLLEEFLTVVCASKRLPPVSHDIVHHIVSHGPPIVSKASKIQKLDSENWGPKGGVQAAGGGRHHSAFYFYLVQPTSHGEESRWELVALRRFPAAQQGPSACSSTAGCPLA